MEAVHPAQYSDKPWSYCGDCGMAFIGKEYLQVHWDSKDCDPLTEGTIRALMHSSPITAPPPPKEISTLDFESDLKFSDADVIALNAITAIEEILSDETVVLSALADLERVLNSDCESGDINPGSQSGGSWKILLLKNRKVFFLLTLGGVESLWDDSFR